MPFNSFDFIFVFLPIAVAGYYLIQKYFSHTTSLTFLLLASIAFYGWWDVSLLWVLVTSILVNYFCSYALTNPFCTRPLVRNVVMIFGVVVNLGLIAYYKYFFFATEVSNDLFGTSFNIEKIILPLGISFFTFQQIAFLVDTWSSHVQRQNFLKYALFVTFFPQLIAGPIVRHDELLPQFNDKRQFSHLNLSVGLAFFIIGLFKKVVIADNLALFATPVFVKASGGSAVTFLDAWGGAMTYGLQLYFDISGYADMAVGLGRMFGVRIPLNFNSPFKATGIIDFWQRWHLTLTHFLTGYCYNPITMKVTRYRMKRGLPGLRGGIGTPGAFFTLLAFPSIVTMTLAGIWHGAGYQFVAFGFLHGLFLVINHAWRGMVHKSKIRLPLPLSHVMRFVSIAFTLTMVIVLFVPFRADSLETTVLIWQGMVGLNGIEFRENYLALLGPLGPVLQQLGVEFTSNSAIIFKGLDQLQWIAFALFICWALPNTQEFVGGYLSKCDQGVSSFNLPSYTRTRNIHPWLQWQPNLLWMAVALYACGMIINKLTSTTEFLYFQF